MQTALNYLWVERDDWPRWVEVNSDVFGSYDDWLKNVQQFEQQALTRGAVATKVNVKPDDFLAWCQRRGVDVNAHARSHYAAFGGNVGNN